MTAVLVPKHVMVNGMWTQRLRVLSRDNGQWVERDPELPSPSDIVLTRYQARAAEVAAEQIRLEDESDEGWMCAEERAREALAALHSLPGSRDELRVRFKRGSDA